MIAVQGLTKRYSSRRPPAVNSVSFEVEDGETVGFVGLNGAGKTTTIKVAVGAHLPTSGTVLVDGFDIVRDKVKACMSLGWVPEFPNFDMGTKAWTLLKYYAGYYKGGFNSDSRCREVLRSVGLDGAEGKRLREYSQGMKKRFALGVSLISNPHNLVFDEVLNGLDPEGIAYFRQIVLEYKKEGRAILFSSHVLTEVEALADKIVFLHKGSILKVAKRGDLVVASKDSLRIVVDNIDQRAAEYLNTQGQALVEGKTVTMYDLKAKPSEINSELTKRGYSVSELVRTSSNLEDYFFRLIGEHDASFSQGAS
ncbi:MAG: ABC transporter ATP-binding protein [Nitrososphaerota archaeon]|jgi:ABC-2 type transport system ATP-binding protein|nr:ABC transporter ATP-binding protein [Nitrososphaerota archaeon]